MVRGWRCVLSVALRYGIVGACLDPGIDRMHVCGRAGDGGGLAMYVSGYGTVMSTTMTLSNVTASNNVASGVWLVTCHVYVFEKPTRSSFTLLHIECSCVEGWDGLILWVLVTRRRRWGFHVHLRRWCHDEHGHGADQRDSKQQHRFRCVATALCLESSLVVWRARAVQRCGNKARSRCALNVGMWATRWRRGVH